MTTPRSSLARKRLRRRLVWAVLGLCVVAAVVTALVLGPPRPEVEVAAVLRGTYLRYVEEDGRTRLHDRYVISAPLAGTLERVGLRIGDAVGAGSVVAVIRPAPSALLDVRSRAELEQRLGAAEARLRSTRATVAQVATAHAQAEKDLARARELSGSGAITARELEVAVSLLSSVTHERDAADQAVHVAEHELEQARAALRSSTSGAPAGFELRAPVAGRVIEIQQQSETVVVPGTPVLAIGDPAALEIVVDLISTDAVHVEPGMEAAISGWGRPGSIRGRVRAVQPVARVRVSALGVEEERVDVVVDPMETSDAWRRVGDGYRVDVRIPVERFDDALRLPTGALFRSGDAWMAFVVADGVVRATRVTVVSYGPVESVVAEGVGEGESVVVQPPESLRDGMRVAVRPAS